MQLQAVITALVVILQDLRCLSVVNLISLQLLSHLALALLPLATAVLCWQLSDVKPTMSLSLKSEVKDDDFFMIIIPPTG